MPTHTVEEALDWLKIRDSDTPDYIGLWHICIELHQASPRLVPIFLQEVIQLSKAGEFPTMDQPRGKLHPPFTPRVIYPRYSVGYPTPHEFSKACATLVPEIFDDRKDLLDTVAANFRHVFRPHPDGQIALPSHPYILAVDSCRVIQCIYPKWDSFWIARSVCYNQRVDYNTIFTANVLLVLFDLGLKRDQLSISQKRAIDKYRTSARIHLIACFRGCTDLASLVIDYL